MKAFHVCLPLALGLVLVAPAANAQTITQDDYLIQLVQAHPLFERVRLAAEIERADQGAYLGAEDWNLFYSATLSHEEPVVAFAGPERTQALLVGAGVERIYWSTGGRLSASFSTGMSHIKIDPLFGFPENFFMNEVAFTYTHPLRRNRGGMLERLPYELKDFDIEFQEVQAVEQMEDFLAGAAARFLNWVFLGEQRTIVEERLRLSEEELARVQRRREANLVDQVDVLRAQDAVSFWQQNLVLVESQRNAARAELAVLAQNDGINALEPEFDLYALSELPPLEGAVAQMREQARLLSVLQIRIDQLQYARTGFEEALKPDLSLLAQWKNKRWDNAFGKSYLMDNPDFLVGLRYSIPVGNRTAQARIQQTDLQATQIERQAEEIALGMEAVLTNVYIQIQEMEAVLELNQQQITSAQTKTQEELSLYNQGRGNLTFVIQSRDSEQNAKLTYAANALAYQQLVVQYLALMDELFVPPETGSEG